MPPCSLQSQLHMQVPALPTHTLLLCSVSPDILETPSSIACPKFCSKGLLLAVLANNTPCFAQHQVLHSTIPHAVGPAGAAVRLNKRKREGDPAGYDRRPPSLIPSTSASLPGAQDVSYLFPDRGPILEECYAYHHALQGALPGMFRSPGKHC